MKNSLKKISYDTVLWFAYPKGKSDLQQDINRDSLREIVSKSALKTVTAISIDDIWSALRIRPIEKAGK